jgi:hypothetical protein
MGRAEGSSRENGYNRWATLSSNWPRICVLRNGATGAALVPRGAVAASLFSRTGRYPLGNSGTHLCVLHSQGTSFYLAAAKRQQ